MAKILKKGSKGKDVQKMQEALNKKGASPKLQEDGDFGKLTEKAVLSFQKMNKLATDGQAGEMTLHHLKIAAKPKVAAERVVKTHAQKAEDIVKQFNTLEKNTAEISQNLAAIAKYVAQNRKNLATKQKMLTATRRQLVPIRLELANLEKEFAKAKNTHLARATAIAAQMKALEAQAEALKKAFNSKVEATMKGGGMKLGMMISAFDGSLEDYFKNSGK